MGEMRGEVGKRTPKKEMDNPSFIMTSHADILSDFLRLHKTMADKSIFIHNDDTQSQNYLFCKLH